LTRLGEEIILNLSKPKIPNPAMFSLIQEYSNYLKVAEEFFEWVFSSPDQRSQKE